ncbi:MAG: hypothetical protein O7G85_10435 [Planctomycetota bacterium]|nr:hypothetical protein [Planctomycetota bacterium]
MCTTLGSEFESLLNHPDFIGILAITMGCLTGMIAIVFHTMTGMAKSRAREATKREIAAYVAEGSIEPDKAIAMLNAGRSGCEITEDGVKIT